MAADNATSNGESAPPTFSEDPVSFLSALANSVPSKDGLGRLAGPVAVWMKEEANPQVAAMYLRAVTRHLPTESPSSLMAIPPKPTDAT